MPLTPEQRRRWDLQVAALREAESYERPDAAARAATIADANAWRKRHGIRPLKDEFEDADELGLHERAIALGLRRPIR